MSITTAELPENLKHGVSRIAEHLMEATLIELFGSPILAFYALQDSRLTGATPFLQQAKKWTRKYINDLPDAAFAVIEPDYKSGKTEDKNARHLPHHDASVKSATENSSVDLPHLKNALARVNQIKPVTGASAQSLISKAKSHLQAHAKALGVGDDNKEASSMKTKVQQADAPGAPDDQPTQSYGFPGQAPSPEGDMYQYPGKDWAPGVTDTERENDESTLTKNAPHPRFSPPGDKTGTPPAPNDPAYQEIDEDTFPKPGGTPYTGPEAGMDLNLSVTPGRQTPETERHQIYQRQQREGKPGGPRPPWERSQTSIYQSDDGHLDSVEKAGQEVDLFHRRHAKRRDIKDFKAMAERFLAERGAMETMTGCTAHMDEQRAYSKEVFAFSYGQVRLSFTRAMRQFVADDAEPDMETYHSLQAMRADLLGENSRKFFAEAKLPVEIASLVGDGSMMPDHEEPDGDEGEGMEMGGDKPPDKESDGGDDMKDQDVKEAMDLALRMMETGALNTRQEVLDKAMHLAKLSSETRKELAAALPASVPMVRSSNPGVAIAEKNLVHAGTVETAGDQSRMERAGASVIGLFMGGVKPPIHGVPMGPPMRRV